MAPPTTTTEAPTTSEAAATSTEPEPEPTPTADCDFWDDLTHWTFEISNIQDWAEDGGESLEQEERGCGAIARWDWKEGHTPSVVFTLPFFMKAGCVERAIVSAGGPELQCDGHSPWDELSSMAVKNVNSPGQSRWKRPSFPERFKEVNRQAEGKYPHPPVGQHPQYIPMSWSSHPPTI
jgi:chitinase